MTGIAVSRFGRFLRANPLIATGGVIALLIVLTAVFAPLVVPYPADAGAGSALRPAEGHVCASSQACTERRTCQRPFGQPAVVCHPLRKPAHAIAGRGGDGGVLAAFPSRSEPAGVRAGRGAQRR